MDCQRHSTAVATGNRARCDEGGDARSLATSKSPDKRLKDWHMNRYETSTPRAALGLTAVAMAAITMAALVVLPAQLGSVSANASTLAAEKAPAEARFDVARAPSIDVTGAIDGEEYVSPGRAAFEAQECGRQTKSNSHSLAD
jgi:hypothetical protein